MDEQRHAWVDSPISRGRVQTRWLCTQCGKRARSRFLHGPQSVCSGMGIAPLPDYADLVDQVRALRAEVDALRATLELRA